MIDYAKIAAAVMQKVSPAVYEAVEAVMKEQLQERQERADEEVVELSPILKQYKMLKEKNADAIALFRMGDFYESYMEDAVKVSEVLGVTLTTSTSKKWEDGSKVKFAAFPHHALDTYLPKLIRAGYRVAICDQLEKPCEAKSTLKTASIIEYSESSWAVLGILAEDATTMHGFKGKYFRNLRACQKNGWTILKKEATQEELKTALEKKGYEVTFGESVRETYERIKAEAEAVKEETEHQTSDTACEENVVPEQPQPKLKAFRKEFCYCFESNGTDTGASVKTRRVCQVPTAKGLYFANVGEDKESLYAFVGTTNNDADVQVNVFACLASAVKTKDGTPLAKGGELVNADKLTALVSEPIKDNAKLMAVPHIKFACVVAQTKLKVKED